MNDSSRDIIPERPAAHTVSLFGLRIWKDGYGQALDSLCQVIQDGKRPSRVVVTPNVDHLVKLQEQPELREPYAQADYLFPDGFPLVIASRVLGAPIAERVTGADLFTMLCRRLAGQARRVFLFGGVPEKEEETNDQLERAYPGLQVRSYSPRYGFDVEGAEARHAVTLINAWHPQVVFVCLGMPKQELWTFRYRQEMDTELVLCVGAALDFVLGRARRAPLWVQKMNMEWLWRLSSDPRRLWKRYLVDDLAFLGMFWKEWRGRK